MEDSDDYPIDDFFSGDQVLAALQNEEQKHVQRQRTPTPQFQPGLQQINKRNKTSTGWAPGIGASSMSYEDLPEISVQLDGTYGVSKGPSTSRSAAPTSYQKRSSVAPSRPERGRTASPSHFLPSSRASTPLATSTRPASHFNRQIVNGHAPSVPSRGSHPLQSQIDALKSELEKLRSENEKAQAALKEATEIRYRKEGEVTVLRKGIEKTAQSHANQIAQLKADKEKADHKQLTMQKDMKEEIERLRTQYLFKQQELEASARRPPGSIRAKRNDREFPPSTPVPTSTISGWSASGSRYRLPFVEGTPSRTPRTSRPPPPPVFKLSPSKSGRKSPEKGKNSILPGFQNAFDTSTPARSPSRRKGKARMDAAIMMDTPFTSQTMPPAPSMPMRPIRLDETMIAPLPVQDVEPPSSEGSANGFMQIADEDVDMVMADAEDDVEPDEPLEPINWKLELCRILLSHSHTSVPQITIQHILSLAQVVRDPERYSVSCAAFMAVLASPTKLDTYEASVKMVCSSSLYLLCVLQESEQILPLLLLLDLLVSLILFLPAFGKVLLATRVNSGPREAITVTQVLVDIIAGLPPTLADPTRENLTKVVIAFLEVLCYESAPDSIAQFTPLVQNRDILANMIDRSRPLWFLERSTKLLVFLSTHPDLCAIFSQEISGEGRDDSAQDSPLVECLCEFLVNFDVSSNVLKANILTFFGQLSVSDAKAHSALGSSNLLIPSVILLTSHLATLFWEDNEELTTSPESIARLLQLMDQTLFVGYQLVFGSDPCINLRSKVQQPLPRQFNSLMHIFTVAFGRLSYCDPPNWVDKDRRQDLESIAEMSRDLLELVIDGPEGDSIWAAFQSEPDEESAIDEEEARLMGVDS